MVALPGEAEWEKAARGGLEIPREPYLSPPRGLLTPPKTTLRPNPHPTSRYPWGDGFDPDKANTAETGLGTTTAVGTFPLGASPYGVLDLSGNVWEWTRSIPKDYPYDPTDGREDLQVDAPRVLRGGSFVIRWNARAAVRNWLNPSVRYRDYGFRVVVVPEVAIRR